MIMLKDHSYYYTIEICLIQFPARLYTNILCIPTGIYFISLSYICLCTKEYNYQYKENKYKSPLTSR